MISDKFIWVRHQINNHLVGKLLPVSWFGPKAPAKHELSAPSGRLKLEIVSHCWQYAHMLNFQLSSLVNHTPQEQQEFITDLLPAEHAMLNQNPMHNVDIDVSLFSPNAITKAKGAFQIVHGDVARQCGYCKDMSLYQQPSSVWRKTFEDSMFRRLIESEGVPIQVDGLHRIRHQEKGRYASGSKLSQLRKNIRVATDDQG